MNIKPCVVGLGYVGLPILARLSKKFDVIGFDINKERIKTLRNFNDSNNEFKNKDLKKIKIENLTSNYLDLVKCNFYIVCVPTPINKFKKPDLYLLKKAFKNLSKVIKKGDIIVLESTVYPGSTENVCVPILEKYTKLKNNVDFFVCYSPERINPGDKKHTINKIVKLISIPNLKCKNKVYKVYKKVSNKIIFSNSIKETELSKVIENIQRDLNIALMNEIFMFCDKTKLDFKNVLNLASTKWNFIKYDPGLVGGHCLPVDPYYFSYIANKFKLKTNVTLSGRSTNEYMYKFMLEKILKVLQISGNKKNNSKVIFFGLTYKKNVSDIRNSLALKIYKHFQKRYENIYGFDPLINPKIVNKLLSKNQFIKIKGIKYIIILTNHDIFKKYLKKLNKNIKVINIL